VFPGQKNALAGKSEEANFSSSFFLSPIRRSFHAPYLRKARMSLSDGNFDAGLNIRESFFKPLAIGE
jgi:hypothetical protein